jgi:hypothetical protein
MYLAHFYTHVNESSHQLTNLEYWTYGKHTNALQSSNILVKILHVGMDLMACSNGSLEQIFGCLFLEVRAVGYVDWTVVSVQGLIDAWIGEMVSLELF